MLITGKLLKIHNSTAIMLYIAIYCMKLPCYVINLLYCIFQTKKIIVANYPYNLWPTHLYMLGEMANSLLNFKCVFLYVIIIFAP